MYAVSKCYLAWVYTATLLWTSVYADHCHNATCNCCCWDSNGGMPTVINGGLPACTSLIGLLPCCSTDATHTTTTTTSTITVSTSTTTTYANVLANQNPAINSTSTVEPPSNAATSSQSSLTDPADKLYSGYRDGSEGGDHDSESGGRGFASGTGTGTGTGYGPKGKKNKKGKGKGLGKQSSQRKLPKIGALTSSLSMFADRDQNNISTLVCLTIGSFGVLCTAFLVHRRRRLRTEYEIKQPLLVRNKYNELEQEPNYSVLTTSVEWKSIPSRSPISNNI